MDCALAVPFTPFAFLLFVNNRNSKRACRFTQAVLVREVRLQYIYELNKKKKQMFGTTTFPVCIYIIRYGALTQPLSITHVNQ